MIEVIQADRDAAADYLFDCGHDWGYCGEIRAGREHPVVQAFARHRTTSLAAQEALAGYRAAVSFISADSWDGCSDCINILKAARCADMTDAMTINETAEHLKRIRLHYDPAALPAAPSLAAQDGLVEARLREAIELAITQRALDIIRGDNESDLHNCLEQYAEVATNAALASLGDKP